MYIPAYRQGIAPMSNPKKPLTISDSDNYR